MNAPSSTSDAAISGGANRPRALLLMLSTSQSLASELESRLRNEGHPVRIAWAGDLEDFEDSLTRADPDLLICATADDDPSGLLAGIVALSRKHGADQPLLALANRRDPEGLDAAITAGARDLVSHEDEAAFRHLQHVLEREFAARRDTRRLRETRMRLAEFEARHRALLSDSADAVAHVAEGIVIDANAAFAVLAGAETVDNVIGLPFMDCVADEDLDQLRALLTRLVKGRAQHADVELRLAGGKSALATRLERREDNGEICIDVMIRAPVVPASPDLPGQASIEDRRAARNQLRELVENGPDGHGLLYLVVDAFDKLEERLGMIEAAQAAGTMAQLARDHLPEGSRCYRFSAHELCALVPVPSSADLEPVADSLRKELASQLFKTDSFESHLPCTLVAYPLGARTGSADDIINDSAREARQRSAEGGNCVVSIGAAAREAAVHQREQAIADGIRRAVREQRLKLAYQSIASLDGDARQFFDVLVRMIDDSGNERLARDFLPVARKHGLIQDIDTWVLARTLQMLDKRGPDKTNTTFMVRIDEETLIEGERYLSEIERRVRAHAVPEGSLVIQIQESVLQNHVRKAKAFCDRLRQAGVSFAVDYFGAGQTSSSLLGHFQASFVKFHPDFARHFDSETSHKRLTELISVAQSHQAKIIIPYVEDTRVMAQLWQMGINYLQGNGLQEPEVVMLSAEAR